MESWSYAEIRHSLLDALYAYFLAFHGKASTRPAGEEIGYVDYQFENVYTELPTRVMKLVVLLAISGGRFPDQEAKLRSDIALLINEYGLADIIGELEKGDADDLRNDMRQLGLVI